MDTLRGVVIGLGAQALSDQIPALLAREDVQLGAVVDPSPAARANFATAFPGLDVPSYSDVAHALNVVKPDFAVVAVPHHLYYDIVVELCTRGIPFMKEKPLARNLNEAEQLMALPGFDRYGFVTAQRRFSGLFAAMWQALGRIGKPYLFEITYKLNIADPHAGWRGQRDQAGGGCLLDMGYHVVDLITWWFGMPERLHANVSALAVPGVEYDAEDSATVIARYGSGLHGTLLVSRRAGAKYENISVYGTDGHLSGNKKGATLYDRDGEVVETFPADEEDMVAAQLRFFLSRVGARSSFEDIQADHMANMRFIDACYTDALVGAQI